MIVDGVTETSRATSDLLTQDGHKKKRCEHTSTVSRVWADSKSGFQGHTITCNFCGMVRKLGDWEVVE